MCENFINEWPSTSSFSSTIIIFAMFLLARVCCGWVGMCARVPMELPFISLSFSRALVFQSVIILCLSVLTWRDLWELVKIQTWVPNLHRIPNEIPTRSAKRIMFKMYYFTSKMCGERWGEKGGGSSSSPWQEQFAILVPWTFYRDTFVVRFRTVRPNNYSFSNLPRAIVPVWNVPRFRN